jgi:hypothetical protein
MAEPELDLARIKQNVGKMVNAGAPEADIDSYIAAEGATLKEIQNFSEKKKEDVSAGMALRGIPVLGAYVPQAEAAPFRGPIHSQALESPVRLIPNAMQQICPSGRLSTRQSRKRGRLPRRCCRRVAARQYWGR